MVVDELIDIKRHFVIACLEIRSPTVVVHAHARRVGLLEQIAERIRKTAQAAVDVEDRLEVEVGGRSDAAQRAIAAILSLGPRRRSVARDGAGDMGAVAIRIARIARPSKRNCSGDPTGEVRMVAIDPGVGDADQLAATVIRQGAARVQQCAIEPDQRSRVVGEEPRFVRSCNACDSGQAGDRSERGLFGDEADGPAVDANDLGAKIAYAALDVGHVIKHVTNRVELALGRCDRGLERYAPESRFLCGRFWSPLQRPLVSEHRCSAFERLLSSVMSHFADEGQAPELFFTRQGAHDKSAGRIALDDLPSGAGDLLEYLIGKAGKQGYQPIFRTRCAHWLRDPQAAPF